MQTCLQTVTISDTDLIAERCHENRVYHAVFGWTTVDGFLRLVTIVLFLLSALLLLGAGGVFSFHTTEHHHKGEGLLVDSLVKSFGDAPSGRKIAVMFTLTNRSAQPIRILGSTPYCGRHGCLAFDKLPLDIPPLSKRHLVVFAETRAPGQFDSKLTIFSDGPGQSQTILRITGQVIENDEKF